MTGLVRRATLLTAAGLLAASAALAGVPSAGTSSVPACITVSGTTGGTPDAKAQFSLTIRDAASNPVPNSVVVVNFAACSVPGSDIVLSSSQPFAGSFVNCAAKSVSSVTNASGVVTFRIVGAAANTSSASGHGAPCATITADGVALGSKTVAAYDQTNSGGTSAGDLARWSSDFFFGAYRGRSDYNCSNTVSAGDLSLWSSAFFAGGSTATGPACGP